MAVELGTGYVSLTVSAKGIEQDIRNELNVPVARAAKETGETASKNIAGGVRSGAGAVEGEVKNLGSKFSGLGGSFKEAGSQLQSQFGGVGQSILAAGATPAVLASGVAAAGLVAAKSVTMFENLGLEIGKLSDATGLSSEQASRWVEVANDAGVSTESLSTSLGFMEKTAGKTPAVFEKLGVELAKTATGALDVNQTFLNAIDVVNGIEDPTKRAAVAQQLFGRSWQNMAELVSRGSGKLKADLESVQPSKIYTDKDVDSSRKVRDAFDQIKDAGEGLMLTLGRGLAPVVAELAPLIADAVAALEPFVQILGGGLAAAVKLAKNSITVWTDLLQGFADSSHASFIEINDDWGDFFTGIKRDAKGSIGPGIEQYRENQAQAAELTAKAAPLLYEQARAQKAANAEAERYTAQAALYIGTQQAINDHLDKMKESYDKVFASGSDTARQVDAFGQVLKTVSSDAEASTLANLGLNEAYDGLTQSVKDNGKTFDDHTSKGRENIKALLGVGDAIRDNLLVQLRDSKGSYEQVTKSADLYRLQLIDQMNQAGLSADEQQHYLEVLGLTPEQVETEIKLSNAEAARQAVDALNISLDMFDDPVARKAYVEAIARGDWETALNIVQTMTGAHDKTVNYNVVTNHIDKYGVSVGNGVKVSAKGGPAAAGEAHLVGDGPNGQIGPWTEMFIPDTSGTIIPAPQLRSMLSNGGQSYGTAGGTGGAGINIEELHVHDELDLDGAFRYMQFALTAAA